MLAHLSSMYDGRPTEVGLYARVPRLACEVNLEPPNEPSMRFHERHGFARVGEQPVDGKIVAMLVKELA